MKLKWIFLAAVVIMVVAFFYFKDKSPTGAITSITTYTPEESGEDEAPEVPKGAQLGDLVKINYVLRLADDNSVADTNNPELAKQFGIKNYVKGPFTFFLGKSGKVKGFDEAIVGMEPGEKNDFVLPPSEPKTVFVLNKTQSVSSNKVIPRRQVFPLSRYSDFFNRKPVIGDVVYNQNFPWLYKVLNFSENSVLAEIFVKPGDEFVLPGTEWKSVALRVSELAVSFRQNPENGQVIQTEFGPAVINLTPGYINVIHNPKLGMQVNYSHPMGTQGFTKISLFEITEVDEKQFVIERIDNLAEETLNLEVELLEAEGQ